MATHLGDSLGPDLWEQLRDGQLYRQGGLGAPILTIDDGGWPNVAIAACAVARTPQQILFPVGAHTGTLRYLERDGKCTLVVAAPGLLAYVKGEAQVHQRSLTTLPQESAVLLRVTGVWLDHGKLFEMTGGITYRFTRDVDELAKVEQALLDELVALLL